MANTFTNVNVTKVESEIIEALKLGLTPLDVFSLEVGSSPAEKNEVVTVPIITARTAASNATNYENGNTTVVGKDVNLDTNISCSWHITAIQASKQDTDYFAKAAKEAVYSVAYAAQLKALNLITRASYGTSVEAVVATGAACDSDELFDIRNTVMNTLKWRPTQNPKLVLDGAYYAGLGKDPAVKDLSASGAMTAQTGEVGRHAGFGIYENGVIAASTPYGATEYLRGFACLPQAMALAIRPPALVGSAAYDINEIVTDPDGGLSLNYRQWVNTSSNTLWGSVEILMGGIKVDGNALYRIVSQTSS
jgi:hypothetical protein